MTAGRRGATRSPHRHSSRGRFARGGAHFLAALAVAPLLAAGPAEAAPLEITVRARAFVPGEPIRIEVRGREPLASCGVECLGAPMALAAAPDGLSFHGLCGIDLEARPGAAVVRARARTASGRALEATRTLRVRAAPYRSEHLRVAPEFVEPPLEVKDRIAREKALLDTLFTAQSPPPPPGFRVTPPVAGPSRNFGVRRVFNGTPRAPHSGADFRAAEGTSVAAAARGRVVLAADLYFSGKTCILDHGGGLFTLYAHLRSLGVREGDEIERGAEVGTVGHTGRVTGPHLHWAARVGSARVNPVSLVALFADPKPPRRR